ncbi:MAG: MarR family transcriptional regulator [Kineosporiaceae bacterium]
MSDPRSASAAPASGGTPHSGPNQAYVAGSGLRTSSLTALRELLEVGARVGPAVARRARLSHSELAALEALMEQPLGPVDLSRELGVTSAAGSGIVDRLEARGHVTRQAHATDGRRTQVVITPSGREEVIGYLMPMFVELARLDSGLDETERALITRYLQGAIAAIRRLL